MHYNSKISDRNSEVSLLGQGKAWIFSAKNCAIYSTINTNRPFCFTIRRRSLPFRKYFVLFEIYYRIAIDFYSEI